MIRSLLVDFGMTNVPRCMANRINICAGVLLCSIARRCIVGSSIIRGNPLFCVGARPGAQIGAKRKNTVLVITVGTNRMLLDEYHVVDMHVLASIVTTTDETQPDS